MLQGSLASFNLKVTMVEKPNTHPQHSDLTAHENDAGTVDKSIIGKIWTRSVVAEQQLHLLRRLAKLKLGNEDIEKKFIGIANCMKTEKYKVRDVEEISNIMNKKVIDAECVWEKADKNRCKARKKIEENFGRNKKKTRNWPRRLACAMRACVRHA